MLIIQNVVVKCRHTQQKINIHKNIENDLLKKIIISKTKSQRKSK